MVSKSSNKIHQTWEPPFSRALYMAMSEGECLPGLQMTFPSRANNLLCPTLKKGREGERRRFRPSIDRPFNGISLPPALHPFLCRGWNSWAFFLMPVRAISKEGNWVQCLTNVLYGDGLNLEPVLLSNSHAYSSHTLGQFLYSINEITNLSS